MCEPVADSVDQAESLFFIGRNDARLNGWVDLLGEAELERIYFMRRDS